MARGGEMQRVDLVEGHEVEQRAAPAPPRSRRRTLAWVAAGVVVALALLGGQRWMDARREAELAALAEVPGVLAPVEPPLQVVERLRGDDMRTRFGPSGTVEYAADGSQRYVWTGTGGNGGWTVTLLGPTPAFASAEGVFDGTQCQTDGDRPSTYGDPYMYGYSMSSARRVVCLVTDGGQPYTDVPQDRVPATFARVVVLDAEDGAVRAEWPADPAQTVTVLGKMVVLGWADGDDAVVSARDLRTGETLWTHRLQGTPPRTDEEADLRSVVLSAAGGMLLVDSLDGQLTVFTPDGEVSHRFPRQASGMPAAQWTELRSGQLVLTSADRGGRATTTVVSPDGGPAADVTVAGANMPVTVDDGSVPHLLLTESGKLQAWDALTGEALWTAKDLYVVGQVLVMLGRVYVASTDGVVALDAGTGEAVWSVPWAEGGLIGTLYTDASHILVATDTPSQAEPGGELVALDRDSGEQVFRARYPRGVSVVSQLGRMLMGVVEDSDEFVLIR
ncbi:outer membrane protein assembly factor BamB family protein [Cellulomonas edaphi]|uniref:PQQ-binding-like beta-propeller repeat protein n=1 Tax=Cellulomonas edaphi TaxID=3053468 RepID=A0ABT7SAD4_9CELL|nr:PQQ-binding-like beta-propeller repeat protein [Cellulomons edaphi]MDM7832593.1 PQQ-binding-like beta-propeller repeat protein [Cellulomons edaphi]